MKADFHLHTSFSADCDIAPEQMLQAALERGVTTLCITDHSDMDWPYPEMPFYLDIDSYFPKLRQLQRDWEDKLDIRIGLELGLQPHLCDTHRSYVSQHPFDFVIGSIHLVDHMDPFFPEFWENCTVAEGIRRYPETILENIAVFDDFDVFGHLDYIVRYAPEGHKKFIYSDYADLVDEILKTLISKGKGIEVNTGGLKAGLGVPNPCPDILRRYRELGGEIITTGSDAHFPEYVGFRFEDAQEILRNCGFRYFTIFKDRKPEFIKL